jgi:hypothetical protein
MNVIGVPLCFLSPVMTRTGRSSEKRRLQVGHQASLAGATWPGLHCGNREVRLEDDAILHAIGALVWGIGLGAVAIAPTFPPFPLQRRAVAQPAKHAPKGRRGAVPGANQASISAVRI